MKIQSIDSKEKLAIIVSSVGKNPMSWQGWSCLKIEIKEENGLHVFEEHMSWVQSILESYLGNVEGSVYFCKNRHIHVFCKNVPDEILHQTGHQVHDLLSFEDGYIEVTYNVFDLKKDGFFYVSDTLEQEDGMYSIPISTYSDLDPFISQTSLKTDKPFIEKNIANYKNLTKVLLVEDDPVTRWIVRKSLKSECVLSTAPTANQAFEKISIFNPDIVFLDIDLPDQNGRKVLEWIMRNDPGTSVIMFSSNNNLENITDTLEDGARGFIAKPFMKEELMHYINNHSR